MSRVLLTGGNGFIASHILDLLLQHGHSVVTTVRSQAKACIIKEAYPDTPKSMLDVAIVEDLAQEGAFDKAAVSDPPFTVIIHTASPFHFNIKDIKKDFFEPAIRGTTNILKAAQAYAPTVERIIITSSFAAMIDIKKGDWPEHTYSEKDWCPITKEEAVANLVAGYTASKTWAEQAAWEFVQKEKVNYTITTICPPIVYGPVMHRLSNLDSLNTSNVRVLNVIAGEWKMKIPKNDGPVWVDVRDLALGHVKAIEVSNAANKRFFVTAGHCSNKEMVDVIRRNFPDLVEKLPVEGNRGGDFPEGGIYGFDNQRAIDILGIQFRSFEESIVDTVKSLQSVLARA